MKSNICLHLSAGAKLIASPRRRDYLPIGYNHNEMGDVYSALYALDQENITVKGEGIIDLSGRLFYHNVSFSNLICIAERPIGVVASKPLIKNVRLKDIVVDIVPEIRPSLKGNVIDLAPGPVNYEIPRGRIGVVYKNAHVMLENVTDHTGNPVEVVEIDA